MSRLEDLNNFIESTTGESWVWFVKRLSANDTGASGSHQAGTYFPKAPSFSVFPSLLSKTTRGNRTAKLKAKLWDVNAERAVVMTWYREKTRDETRITRWAGLKRNGAGALADDDATGALAVFAFYQPKKKADAQYVHVWVCHDPDSADEELMEEEFIADRVGPVEAGRWLLFPDRTGAMSDFTKDCSIKPADRDFDPKWLRKMPSGETIARLSIARHPFPDGDIDKLLLDRRECEFALFLCIEKEFWSPKIKGPFANLDEFLKNAQSILQSRKSRSGRSLEIQLRQIMTEFGMREGIHFEHGKATELGKVPDFLFPTAKSYNEVASGKRDPSTVRMLAVKTTLKDRWRQVIDEAANLPRKHLLTLQDGISDNQFKQVAASNITLVVPKELRNKKYKKYKNRIITLEEFLSESKALAK